MLEQASSEQYVIAFSLEIPEVKISGLQGCSMKAFPYAQLVLSCFLYLFLALPGAGSRTPQTSSLI